MSKRALAVQPVAEAEKKVPAVGGDAGVAEHAPIDATDSALLARVVGANVADRLLREVGDLRGVFLAADQRLLKLGLGRDRLRLLRDAAELGGRVHAPSVLGTHLRSAGGVAEFFGPRIGCLEVREFWSLALVGERMVQSVLFHSRGTETNLDVFPNSVLRDLVRAGASAVAFCTNHPWGTATPMDDEVESAVNLRHLGKLIDIEVVDFVVVAPGGHRYSVIGALQESVENAAARTGASN